jgi:lysine-specific demethylase 8/hypoxia-inducible factor 1-alpha inhibitor (HIF hydroxylase)
MQLHGEKHVILFPPSQLKNLYPFPLTVQLRRGLAMRPGYSQTYPASPDFRAFPKLQKALRHRHDVVIGPGDVLFIPAGWWHEITTLGDGMVCSVNRFWHVQPFSRSLTWNKWRIHLGSLLGSPHILKMVFAAAISVNPRQELDKLLQKL